MRTLLSLNTVGKLYCPLLPSLLSPVPCTEVVKLPHFPVELIYVVSHLVVGLITLKYGSRDVETFVENGPHIRMDSSG